MSSGVRPVYEVKAGLFRVLGHPARVRIIELLREGERSVGALQAELGLESGAPRSISPPFAASGSWSPGGTGRASSTARRTRRCSTSWRRAARSSRAASRSSSRCCRSSPSRDVRRAGAHRCRAGRRRGPDHHPRAHVHRRARRPGDRVCPPRGRRALGPRDRRGGGIRVHERVRPADRGRRPVGPLPRRAGGGRRGGARVRRPVPGAVGARPGDRRADRAVRSRAGARPGGARPAHVPPRVGGDDARARRGDPRRPCGRGRASHGLLLRRADAPRRCRNVGRRPPPRTGGRDRRPDRRLVGVGRAGGDRARGARRDGGEGRADAAPRLAPARAPDRAGAGVGVDERRDDQDRRLRARARARRVARRPAGVARGARARRRGAVGGRRRGVRAVPARAETAARVPFDRERGDHRARSRRMPRAARAGSGRLGRLRARGRAAPHA